MGMFDAYNKPSSWDYQFRIEREAREQQRQFDRLAQNWKSAQNQPAAGRSVHVPVSATHSGPTPAPSVGVVLLMAISTFCSLLCMCFVYAKVLAKLGKTPGSYGLVAVFVLTLLYGRVLNRVRKWEPQSTLGRILLVPLWLGLSLGPIALVLEILNRG